MPKPKAHMTSLEAAALYMSQGKTDDIEQAELLQEGKILDPDRLERAYYRRALGFDFSILRDEEHHKWIVRDDELNLKVTATLFDDDNINAQKLAKACMKLKKLHDKALEESDDDA